MSPTRAYISTAQDGNHLPCPPPRPPCRSRSLVRVGASTRPLRAHATERGVRWSCPLSRLLFNASGKRKQRTFCVFFGTNRSVETKQEVLEKMFHYTPSQRSLPLSARGRQSPSPDTKGRCSRVAAKSRESIRLVAHRRRVREGKKYTRTLKEPAGDDKGAQITRLIPGFVSGLRRFLPPSALSTNGTGCHETLRRTRTHFPPSPNASTTPP